MGLFDNILIGFVLVALVVTMGVFMIDSMNDYDDVNLSDDELGEIYDKVDDIFEITEDAKNKTLDGDISETDSWESMTKGSYSAVRLLTNSFGFFQAITRAIANTIGIPPVFVTIAFTIFALVLIFGIIYMIFRFKP